MIMILIHICITVHINHFFATEMMMVPIFPGKINYTLTINNTDPDPVPIKTLQASLDSTQDDPSKAQLMELDYKRLEWNTLCCQSNEQKRRCFMFFNNSVCLLWQVARFQSVQGQATSLDPKPRLKRGAISLSDSGTRPGLSSYPLAHIQIHKYTNRQIHKYTIYLTLPRLTLHRRTSNYGSSSSLISPVLRFKS